MSKSGTTTGDPDCAARRPSLVSADRVVALIDMDCFYCEVERQQNRDLIGVPMAVVQYNPFYHAAFLATFLSSFLSPCVF